MTFGNKLISFYKNLKSPRLPKGIEIMNPYKNKEAFSLATTFAHTFYNDQGTRIAILGINPGRFGGGNTGVNFTDAVALEEFCNISTTLPRRREISSDFIYKVIQRYGGSHSFYKTFFLSAICPLGFTKAGVNYNYYDDPQLEKAVHPFITQTLQEQIKLGCSTRIAIVLGTGKNATAFAKLNEEGGYFKEIIPLEHPRFVMQYKRKSIDTYVEKYIQTLTYAKRKI